MANSGQNHHSEGTDSTRRTSGGVSSPSSRRSSLGSAGSVTTLSGPRCQPVLSNITGATDRFMDEALRHLELHQDECRKQFREWQADLKRIQREHSTLCQSLEQKLKQPPVAVERVSQRIRTELRPGLTDASAAPRPPVPGFVPPPPASPARAWAEPAAQARAWAEPTVPELNLGACADPETSTEVVALADVAKVKKWAQIALPPPEGGKRVAADNEEYSFSDGTNSRPTNGTNGPRQSSRFGGPIALLYGVERNANNAAAKANANAKAEEMTTTRTMKSVRSRNPFRKANATGTCLQRFVRSAEVRGICSAVILANSVFMGIQAQENIQRLLAGSEGVSPTWEHVEAGFCGFFFLELVLRFFAEQKKFFFSEDTPWNLFDTFLVLLSTVDVIMTFFITSSTLNFTFARTLRIFRFARILRIVRVMRFFYSFRLMVYSVIYSMISLLWVFVMLLFVMYFFAIFFLHGLAEYLENPETMKEKAFLDNLEMHYGSVSSTLISLFMAISGGIDWGDLMRPLTQIGSAYGWIFLFYIFFMVFGVLNVIMANFVDSASQISRKDRELVTQNEMERQKQYAQNIRKFFHEADVDKTGTLSWEEFERYLQNDKVQAYFQSFELDVSQARTLFKLLDLDESDDVGIDEFVEGCMRMKGPARSIDVNMLLYEHEKMIDRQVDFMVFVEEQFNNLDSVGANSDAPGDTPGRNRLTVPNNDASRRRLSRLRTWVKEREEDKRYRRSSVASLSSSERTPSISVLATLGWQEMDV